MGRIWQLLVVILLALTLELELNDVEFSPNGQIFATASTLTQIWDTNSGTELLVCAPEMNPLDLAFMPNGTSLVVLAEDQAIICDMQTGEIRPLFSVTNGSRYRMMALHPNGRLLAVAETSLIHVWDMTTNTLVAQLTLPDIDRGLKLVFSVDGRHLGALTRWSHTVSDPHSSLAVWDTNDWHTVLQTSISALNDFAFSPDGNYLVLGIGVFGGEARILTLADGFEVNRLEHNVSIEQVAFRSDGQQVALRGTFESVILWNWNPDDWIEVICGRVSRNLTYEEWRTYFGYELYHQTCLNLPAPSAP
jgi:WD40 repeat protein